MKYIIIFKIIIFCSGYLTAQNDSIQANNLKITAMIMNDVDDISGSCGTVITGLHVILNKFEPDQNGLDKTPIHVGIICHEFYGRRFFRKGRIYEFEISESLPFQCSPAMNPFYIDDNKNLIKPEFWATEVKLIKK